jgi:hypothetical protein
MFPFNWLIFIAKISDRLDRIEELNEQLANPKLLIPSPLRVTMVDHDAGVIGVALCWVWGPPLTYAEPGRPRGEFRITLDNPEDTCWYTVGELYRPLSGGCCHGD